MTSTIASPPQHRDAVLVQWMRAALEGAAGAGLVSMSLDELGDYVTDLHGLVAQVDAELLSAVREADRREVTKVTGAASTPAWLSGKLRMRPEEAGLAPCPRPTLPGSRVPGPPGREADANCRAPP